MKKAGLFKQEATAIILAGGKSRRFGTDKSLLPINGKTLVEYIIFQLSDDFSQILIGSDNIKKYSFLKHEVVPDKDKGYGPLMGILSCLERSYNELNFVIACDIPNINMELVKQMFEEADGYDVIVPKLKNGFIEPLFAVYRKCVISSIIEILYSSDKRQIRELFNNVRTKYLEINYNIEGWYKNINTKDDYYKFINGS